MKDEQKSNGYSWLIYVILPPVLIVPTFIYHLMKWLAE
jgi:hypothetical protein